MKRWRTRCRRKRGSLALGPHAWGGWPDGRDQVTAGELGEDPGVDLVGLGGQGGQALDLLRIRDLDIPAVQLEGVVNEARAVHRLDGGADGVPTTSDLLDEVAQPVCVGWAQSGGDPLAGIVEDADVEALLLRSNPACSMMYGASFVWWFRREPKVPTGGGLPSWHSVVRGGVRRRFKEPLSDHLVMIVAAESQRVV